MGDLLFFESFYVGPPDAQKLALCTGNMTSEFEEKGMISCAPFNMLVPSEEANIPTTLAYENSSCVNDNSPLSSESSSLTDSLNTTLNINESEGPTGTEPIFCDGAESDKLSSRSTSPKNGFKPQTILPPCRVCSDSSSGFHYGAYTCEACKVFYRRSLKKTAPYRCTKGGNCQIMPHKRLTCSYCRIQKCAAVGMSKQSIKRGRYTLEKKTDCIREVKHLQRQKEESGVPQFDLIDLVPEKVPSPVPDIAYIYDEVIRKLVRNSEKFNSYSREILDNIEVSHAKHLEEVRAIEDVFGPLKLLSQEEYNDLYSCTGIDVDGRKSEWATHLPNLELRIQHMVSFAKTLPGFKDFAVEDQINQIKCSGFDYFMLLSFAAMNVEHRLYTCACGHTRTETELCRMVKVEMVDEMFTAAKHLQRLELTPEELGLLKAYCILSPDRGELKERHKVEKSFNMIQECLMYHIRKYRADEGFLGRLTSTLLSIRTTTHVHDIHIVNLLTNFSSLDFPPLLFELIVT